MAIIVAVDQYGQIERNLGKHPRKELLLRCRATHASKIYRESTHGDYHVGYVIRDRWYTLYEEWQGKKRK